MIFLDEKHAPRFHRDLADSLITLLGAGEKLIQDGQVRDTYHGRRSYLQSVLGMMFWEVLRQYRDANLAYEKSLSPCEISHPQGMPCDWCCLRSLVPTACSARGGLSCRTP